MIRIIKKDQQTSQIPVRFIILLCQIARAWIVWMIRWTNVWVILLYLIKIIIRYSLAKRSTTQRNKKTIKVAKLSRRSVVRVQGTKILVESLLLDLYQWQILVIALAMVKIINSQLVSTIMEKTWLHLQDEKIKH